jgi:hypothetical protein
MMQTRAVTSAIVKVLDYQLPPLAEVEPDGTVNTFFFSGLRHFFHHHRLIAVLSRPRSTDSRSGRAIVRVSSEEFASEVVIMAYIHASVAR